MESSCIKRLCTNERFVFRQEADCWRSKLVHSVGLDILKVFSGTAVLKDLSRLKDCKPASVTNWSFDENCLFCCLRREKVKEHVVALNRQIVESGGKPLLGKDPSNISRLEWQSEEFLNAVLHRTDYKPRIPDPHIPVVACGVMQQMISELATYYTSRNNCTQDPLEDDGTQDQSLLTTSCVTAPAAVDTTPAQSTFIMVDQDAPLDLSVKKIKVEDIEQDGVLDLSTKKSCNKGYTSLRNSHVHVSLATHLVKRDSGALTEDLQSASTLEQFMSRLCLHHQQQIVDALGFLQSEVKTAATSSRFQTLTPSMSEKPAPSCSRVTRPEIKRTGKSCSLEAGVNMTRPHESSDLSPTARVTSEKPVDLCNAEVLSPSSSCGSGTECATASSPTKCLITSKTTTDPLEALDSSIKHIHSSKSLCSAEKSCTSESDQAELLSKQTNSFAQTDDAVINPSTIQKTSNAVLLVSPRTARKSRKGSCHRPMNGSLSCIISDADSHCDLVYIRKSITECQPQSHRRLQPRRNARKSTRGHKYVEEYLELKTVRTLASSKSILDASGNCPARMPDTLTLVSPKQILAKSGSVPLESPPFAGDCVKNFEQLSLEQIMEDEMPGDVVKVTGASLMVETTQTDKIEATTQISHEPSCEQSELINRPDVITDAPSCSPNAVEQEENMEVVEVGNATEVTELAAEREGCDGQISPAVEEEVCGTEGKVVCGTEGKVVCEDESLEPSASPVPPNMAEDLPTDGADVDQSHPRATESPTEVETAADAQKEPEESGMNANADEDGPAQEQDSHDTERNLQTVNSSKLPENSQGDSSTMDVSAVQPLVKCKKDLDSPTPKVSKQLVPSDRCLRSRVSKGSGDVMKDSVKCAASELDDHADDSSLKTQSEGNVHTEDKHDSDLLETGEGLVAATPSSGLVVDHAIVTGPTSGTAPALESDPDLNVNDEVPRVLSPEVLPETENPCGKPLELSNEASESTDKVTLRNKSSPVEVSDSRDCSPVKKPSPNPENMLLRSRSNTERPLKRNSSPEGHSEAQTPPKRSSSGSARDVCSSPEGVTRMPLRSRTISTTKQTVTADPPAQDPVKSLIGEQPFPSESSSSCKKADGGRHMPLRSSASAAAEQPCNTRSAAVGALDSPGRMSLRRGPVSNMEKPCEPTTPPKNKRPLRIQRVSASSSVEAEEKPVTSKLKVQPQKNAEAQISPNPGNESNRIAGLPRTEPVAPKFLEALRGEEHQQLISSLNTKFDRMHKGWVQMDKEGQPAPKPKNKADRLKEIWKSKRRARKSRPLEQQRFSPVQMLFMKPFDLSSICHWFLQSTETKSLVIVKKVNTRLPSETQLCFHTSAAGAAAAHGIFPSLQAERLKKHLKKFAIASPVKNTPKNQRLLSKALGQGLPVMRSREKHEPTTATRICTKAQSLAAVSPSPAPESLGAISEKPGKNPASARILRKYSNMREKLQVQQSKKCKEKSFKGARLKAAIIPKKADEQKLQTRKAPKSAVVQRISSLSKVAKASSALKQRVLKRNKDGGSTKSLKRLPKASANSLRRTLIRTASERLKASGTKAETKKSLPQRGPQSLEPQSLDADSKLLEDQVLTRSQRKMEGVPPQTHSSPKSATKRGLEPLVTPTKRTRTSKP